MEDPSGQVECERAVCLCGKAGQQHPGCITKTISQQAEGKDPSPLFGTSKAALTVLCLARGSLALQRCHTELSPVEKYQGDWEAEACTTKEKAESFLAKPGRWDILLFTKTT